MYLLLSVVS